MGERRIVLVVHNVRSAHNVGSLLRTAEGLGAEKIYFTGYTPYPESESDSRLSHVSQRADSQISKTALGAEKMLDWQHLDDIGGLLKALKNEGFTVAALEQTPDSEKLNNYLPPAAIALIVGSEVEGIDKKTLSSVDVSLEIPMLGSKESYNVAVATGIALYQLRYPR